jgi:hypothetical protein
MGYLPYRDNPELANISEAGQARLSMLDDDLTQASHQQQHEDRCACTPGRAAYWKCIYGPLFPSVSTEEVLALAFARGLLKLPE